MPFLEPPYDLVIDVGCLCVQGEGLGILEGTIHTLFASGFNMKRVDHGETTVANTLWDSAWFYLLRV